MWVCAGGTAMQLSRETLERHLNTKRICAGGTAIRLSRETLERHKKTATTLQRFNLIPN